MLIMSQDRTELVNFNRIDSLWIDTDILDYENKKEFTIESTGDTNTTLGEYSTEERAKEVLNEIMIRFANWENLKAGQFDGECSPIYKMPIYKIPKE